MPTVALEGTGARIAFETSDFTSDLLTLQLPERAREAIETTHLGSLITKTFKPGVLIDPGQVTAEFDHNPAAVKLLKAPPEKITIHYPLEDGQTEPAKLSFQGFCTSEGGEEFTVGSRMTTKLTFQVTSDYDFTKGTTAST
jgi:hypothetical protein